jgi:hypothetical protein
MKTEDYLYMSKIDLSLLFEGLQNQMIAQLSTNRQFITHPGSKGDALENAWIEWLRTYLPNRYSIDKAIVIDFEGNTSHQIDVVIYDRWFTPFVFSQNGFQYIPAEGVYAVFEVKPDIQGSAEGGKNYIQYAGEKIESVRRLNRTSTSMINSGAKLSARPLTKIIGGFLSTTNSYTSKDNSTIERHLESNTGFKGIDIGCIADYGSFHVHYEGEENIELRSPDEFSRRYAEYYEKRTFKKVTFSEKNNSLVSFFLQLTRYLQQAIGTIPAIDLNAYSKTINFEIDEEI